MVRYARQPYKYSCGPTAIINAVKWAGYSYSLRDNHTFVARACNSSYEFGTEELELERVLRRLTRGFMRIRKRCRPTADELMSHVIKQDCAAIILYYRSDDPDGDAHYTLMTDVGAGHVTLVNDVINKTLTRCPKWHLDEKLLKSREDKECFPQAWLLRKIM